MLNILRKMNFYVFSEEERKTIITALNYDECYCEKQKETCSRIDNDYLVKFWDNELKKVKKVKKLFSSIL